MQIINLAKIEHMDIVFVMISVFHNMPDDAGAYIVTGDL
jgi:hypothetical protein